MAESARPVNHSRTTITELMVPSYANFGGKIHGGILLSLMDKAGTYCVTVSVDHVEFLQAVEVGELVSMHGSVNYVGRTSLVVGIRVEALNVRTNVVKHTNSSFFTMVAKDEHERPTEVPKLILESTEDVKRFIESMNARSIKNAMKEQMSDARSQIDVARASELLTQERCILAFK